MDSSIFQAWPTPTAEPMSNISLFLTFADLDSYLGEESKIGMWDSGCLMEDGTHNCTYVCTDPQLLYHQPYSTTGSQNDPEYSNATIMTADPRVPYSIYNCMMYPYISSLLTSPYASEIARSNAQRLADTMHVLPNVDVEPFNDTISLLSKIQSTQWDCVSAFCKADKTCAKGLTEKDFESGTTIAQEGKALSQDHDYRFPNWNSISRRESMDVYADIAGIGVSITFNIQAGVILMCWLFVCFSRYRRFLSDPKHVKFRQVHAQALQLTQSKWVPARTRRASTNSASRLLDDSPDTNDDGTLMKVSATTTILGAIGSFQSAQCFFLISMNIAILIGLATKGPFMMSASFGQFYNNLLYTQAVAQGGVAFVCSTQYCLYAVGKGSVYFYTLTFLTFVISATTFGMAHTYDTRPDASRLALQTADPKLDRWQLQCGMVSPQTFNGSLKRNVIFGLHVSPYILGKWIIGFASAIFVGLAIGMSWRYRLQATGASKLWYRRIFFVYGLFIEICMAGWIITFIVFFWYPVYSAIPKTWSLGQVLAVSIWVPGLIEWAHAGAKLFKPQVADRWLSVLRRSQARPMHHSVPSGNLDQKMSGLKIYQPVPSTGGMGDRRFPLSRMASQRYDHISIGTDDHTATSLETNIWENGTNRPDVEAFRSHRYG